MSTRENNENLATQSARTASGYRGVSWHKWHRKWSAYTKSGGTRYHVGYFDDPKAAYEAVVEKRLQVHTNNLQDRQAA